MGQGRAFKGAWEKESEFFELCYKVRTKKTPEVGRYVSSGFIDYRILGGSHETLSPSLVSLPSRSALS